MYSQPSPPLLQQALESLHCFCLAERSRVHLNLVSFLSADHEQVRQPPILSQMTFAVVEEILALLCLVRKVEFGHLPKCREPEHRQCAGKTGHSAASTLNGTFKELTMDVFHVLQHCDQLVLLGRARDNAGLRQHVVLAARLQLHLIHEVLDAVLVQDAIAVDEEHEQIVVSAKVPLIDFVDQPECLLLTTPFSAMGETTARDTTSPVGYVNAFRVALKRQWYAEPLQRVEV